MRIKACARWIALLIIASLSACAGDKASTADDKKVDAPALSASEEQERQALEQVFHNIFDVPADAEIPARLRDPKSVADAQDVVRSDNIALYAKADKVFVEHLKTKPDDVPNLTWHAQLFLAWADSATVTRRSLQRSLDQLTQEREVLSAKAADESLAAAERDAAADALEELAWIQPMTEKVMADLETVAQEKLKIGAEKSLAILKENQETYEGYRLAADLFRLTGDWEKHASFMKKLEDKNPDSNGLRFLKGVVAFNKDKDYHTAERFLKEAVAKDPKFAKAQYYLALTYLNMKRFDHAKAALEQTLAISPGHPFANAMRSYVEKVRKI